MREPYTQLYVHLVWATWDREPIIRPDFEDRLYGEILTKLNELKCKEIAARGTEDHVHLLCRFPRPLSISYLVQQVKGATSHLMSHAIPGVDWFKWQGSYGAFTVTRDDVPRVKEYVLRQKEHHRSGDLWPNWEHSWIPDNYQDEGPGE